jgi:hypothetical protein
MSRAKELLLQQTADAFEGRRDMSLMAALDGITPQQASWRADPNMPTAEQLVRHVAWAKAKYCHDGFAVPMVLVDLSVNDDGDHASLPWEFPCGAAYGLAGAPGVAGAVDLLVRAHRAVIQCLESCSEESLGRPVPGRHGKSAAHLFSILMIHDIYHAGQIRTRRAMAAASGSANQTT